MKTFTLLLQDAVHSDRIEGVISFVGEDASGSFSILADHARMMTSLVMGMARFRVRPEREAGEGPAKNTEKWRYLAVPGALLYLHDNLLSINTRRYLIEDDYERISAALQQQLLTEETALHGTRQSLRQMEEEVLKRMWKLGRSAEAR